MSGEWRKFSLRVVSINLVTTVLGDMVTSCASLPLALKGSLLVFTGMK